MSEFNWHEPSATNQKQESGDGHQVSRLYLAACWQYTTCQTRHARNEISRPRWPHTHLERCVCADTLSLTLLVRYDGHIEHALSSTPDARDAHALQLHVGGRAVLAGGGRGSLEPSTDDGGGRHVGRPAGHQQCSTGGRHEVAPAGVASAGHQGRPRRRWYAEAGAQGQLLTWTARNERRARHADCRCPD